MINKVDFTLMFLADKQTNTTENIPCFAKEVIKVNLYIKYDNIRCKNLNLFSSTTTTTATLFSQSILLTFYICHMFTVYKFVHI